SVTEGTINSWLVKEGDHVNKYDPIPEVMTDKVNAAVPAPYTGTIKEIVATEGETLAVGELMCHIETENDVQSDITTTTPTTQTEGQEPQLRSEQQSMKKHSARSRMRLAQENETNLNTVSGTVRTVRIIPKDQEKSTAHNTTPKAIASHR